MKVARLFAYSGMPEHMVIEGVDGRYYTFGMRPYREITEKDLRPLAYWPDKGLKAKEASERMYLPYGLIKADSPQEAAEE